MQNHLWPAAVERDGTIRAKLPANILSQIPKAGAIFAPDHDRKVLAGIRSVEVDERWIAAAPGSIVNAHYHTTNGS